jgi:hypothetical protein
MEGWSGEGVTSMVLRRWSAMREVIVLGIGVEEGGGAVGDEDCCEEEVAVARGEVAKDGNALVEAKDSLGDELVFLEEFGVDADVPYHLELRFKV